MADYYAKVSGVFENGRPWDFGFHISSAQSPDSINTTFSNAIIDMWTSGAHGLQTLYPTTTELGLTTVYTLDAKMRAVEKRFASHALPGTSSIDSLPNLNSTLVSLRGNSTRKTGRGRVFLPAMAEDQVNNNRLIDAAATRTKAAMVALFAAINADGSTFFVTPTDVKHPPKDGTPLYSKTVVTTPLVSKKPARQARRDNKSSPNYV